MNSTTLSAQPLVISGDKVPTAAYQAIYHKLTSKVEKLSETFNDIYEIGSDDVVHLNRIIEQTIQQYKIEGKNCTCTLSLHEGESLTFSSFEKFSRFNFQMDRPTSKVNYELDFFTILPVEIAQAENIVQRFKISILMDQDFLDEDSSIPFFLRNSFSGNNIILNIEYSDYAVARNLQGAVRDWVKSLRQKSKPKYLTWLDKHSDLIATVAPRLLVISSLAGAAASWSSEISQQISTRYILGSLSFSVLAYAIGHFLIISAYRELAFARPMTHLLFTRGDGDRKEECASRRTKRTALAAFFGLTIFIGLALNISASFLYDILK